MFHIEGYRIRILKTDGTQIVDEPIFDTCKEAEVACHEARLFNRHRMPDVKRLEVINKYNLICYELPWQLHGN